MSARVLVTGAAGQLGRALLEVAWPAGLVPIGLTRTDLDIADPVALDRLLEQQRPVAVINAAAYTGVDQAESDRASAFRVNSAAVAQLAQATAARGVALLHVSSDYVFDGRKKTPYHECDAIAPLNAYGESIAAGEAALRLTNPLHVILRTSWVYAPWGKNFLQTILRLASEKPELRIVKDQWGAPTSALDIARTTLAACQGLLVQTFQPGTYHFAGGGETSWHGFAEAIVARARLATKAVPIPSADYPTAARRPANSRLDCSKITAALGTAPRPWQAMLDEVMARLV